MNIHIIVSPKFTDKLLDLISEEYSIGSNIVYIYDSRYLLMDNKIHFKVRFHEYLKRRSYSTQIII